MVRKVAIWRVKHFPHYARIRYGQEDMAAWTKPVSKKTYHLRSSSYLASDNIKKNYSRAEYAQHLLQVNTLLLCRLLYLV